MLASISTKLAFKKMGIPSDPLSVFSSPESEPKKSKKLSKNAPPGTVAGLDDQGDNANAGWPAWMSVKSLPLAVQPWLTPMPPPIPVAKPPTVGDVAPLDRDRQLAFGGGRKVMVVFLRCVGCAFAQKTFLSLRNLASRHANDLTCIAVSHSSAVATKKWVDLIGGAWDVQVVIDEDRAVYAAWGLGLGSVWYVFNPTTQVAGFKEKGWLGSSLAVSLQRTGLYGSGKSAVDVAEEERRARLPRTDAISTGANLGSVGSGAVPADTDSGPTTVMGNKWQQAGAWAVDGRGKVVWGGKALRADDVMDLEAGIKALGL
ncbi:hypothetical protein QBC46DRAFT_123745 [Diplogelasinospora grovesii]|uniref:Alkyl hydroperoxide reductase subunit C/ Thiol specific antioxidant domain-containing protein n=1 Tax=Diplogelasinospora grovesii TaxID=303347 RepID=A0AAN6N7I0_9PEZI|nr:hypothetical protein QBC46DRAFT_123745 [Diplogelasinospora grovesii]